MLNNFLVHFIPIYNNLTWGKHTHMILSWASFYISTKNSPTFASRRNTKTKLFKWKVHNTRNDSMENFLPFSSVSSVDSSHQSLYLLIMILKQWNILEKLQTL